MLGIDMAGWHEGRKEIVEETDLKNLVYLLGS